METRIVAAEEWKDVSGYEGIYMISSLGRVKRIRRRCDSRSRDVAIVRLLKPKPSGQGYRAVCLSWAGEKAYRYVHELVAGAFIAHRPDGMEVNHKNGNKEDNVLANLEYVTSSENKQHAVRTLGAYCGEANGMSKLTREQVETMRRKRAMGVSLAEIAEHFGIARNHASDILQGKYWAHV